MTTSTFSTGSVTGAMRAGALLEKHGIKYRTVKLDPTKTPNGCSYGIEVAQRDRYRTARLLGTSAHYIG